MLFLRCVFIIDKGRPFLSHFNSYMKLYKFHHIRSQAHRTFLPLHTPSLLHTIVSDNYASIIFTHHHNHNSNHSYQLHVKGANITHVTVANQRIFILDGWMLVGSINISEVLDSRCNKIWLDKADLSEQEGLMWKMMRQANWRQVLMKQDIAGLFWCEWRSDQIRIALWNQQIKFQRILLFNVNMLDLGGQIGQNVGLQLCGLHLDKGNICQQKGNPMWLLECINNQSKQTFLFLCSLIQDKVKSQQIHIFPSLSNIQLLSISKDMIAISSAKNITIWTQMQTQSGCWQLHSIIVTTGRIEDMCYLSSNGCLITCQLVDNCFLLMQYHLRSILELKVLQCTVVGCFQNISLTQPYKQHQHLHFLTNTSSSLLLKHQPSIYLLESHIYSLSPLIFQTLASQHNSTLPFGNRFIRDDLHMRCQGYELFDELVRGNVEDLLRMMNELLQVDGCWNRLQLLMVGVKPLNIRFKSEYLLMQLIKEWLMIFIYLSQWIDHIKTQSTHSNNNNNNNLRISTDLDQIMNRVEFIIGKKETVDIQSDVFVKMVKGKWSKMRIIARNALFVANKTMNRSQKYWLHFSLKHMIDAIYLKHYLTEQYLIAIINSYRHHSQHSYHQYQLHLQQLILHHQHHYSPLIYLIAHLPQQYQIASIHVGRIKQRIERQREQSKIRLEFAEEQVDVQAYIRGQCLESMYCFNGKGKPKSRQEYLDFSLNLISYENNERVHLSQTQAHTMLFAMQNSLTATFISSLNIKISPSTRTLYQHLKTIRMKFILSLTLEHQSINAITAYNLQVRYNCKEIDNKHYQKILLQKSQYKIEKGSGKKMISFSDGLFDVHQVVHHYFKELQRLTSAHHFQNISDILQSLNFQNYINHSTKTSFQTNSIIQPIDSTYPQLKQAHSLLVEQSDQQINAAKILTIELWSLFQQLHHLNNYSFQIYEMIKHTSFIHNCIDLHKQLSNIASPHHSYNQQIGAIHLIPFINLHYYHLAGISMRIKSALEKLYEYVKLLKALKLLAGDVCVGQAQVVIVGYGDWLLYGVQVIALLSSLQMCWLYDFQDTIQAIMSSYIQNIQKLPPKIRLLLLIQAFIKYYQQ